MMPDTELPSTSTFSGSKNNFVICHICDKSFTSRGIHIHIARSHGSSQDSVVDGNETSNIQKNNVINEILPGTILNSSNTQSTVLDNTENKINTSNVSTSPLPTDSSSSDEQCAHCGKYFKGKHGVSIHISKAHPNEHRTIITERQPGWHRNHSILPSSETIDIKETDNSQEHDPKLLHCDLQAYKSEMLQWRSKFQNMSNNNDVFCSMVKEFSIFLARAIHLLPGPKHPAVRYFEARKQKKAFNNQKNYKNHSNPERASKRERERRREKYLYQKTQFQYHNQRRKAVRSILHDNNEVCKVDINKIHHHFSNQFSIPNEAVRSDYPSDIPEFTQSPFEETENILINKQEISTAVNGIAVDTSPGPDHILVRALKDDVCFDILALIASFMLSHTIVPPCLKQARTVLIFKEGNPSDLTNWRPITICSVIRRIIERVLDKRLRVLVKLNENQRGFTSVPGAQINTTILESILRIAKLKKSDATLVFLDISKAFDNVGHKHLEKTLASLSLPPKLSQLIIELQQNNTTQIEVNHKKSKPIVIQRGVMQGSPLSPSLYNIATNHILEELSSDENSEEFGFKISPDLPNLTVMGFADDTLIVGNSMESAERLTKMALTKFEEIGLTINIKKSKIISITKGNIQYQPLILDDDRVIPSLDVDECIRYLGVNFHNKTVFDCRKTSESLQSKLDSLATTALLQPYQKFVILSSFICPTLTYSFLTTPSNRIPGKFLADADIMVKNIKICITVTGRPP